MLTIFLFLPAVATAQKVAVLPVSYWLVWEDAQSPEKEQAVFQEVVQTIEESGYQVVSGSDVDNAARIASGSKATDCRDKDCLSQVATHLEVDNAIFVSIAEEGLLYNVEINLAKGDQEYGPIGGNFGKLRIGIQSMVKAALGPAATPEEPEDRPEEAQSQTESGMREVRDNGKPLGPVPFIVTASVTGALGITWIILESVGYAKLNKHDDDPNYWSEQDAARLQTADRVFLGLTLAGVVTTTVLGFLTDFSNKTDGPVEALVPTPVENGGMLVVKGRF
ncbi:MAG: hypothetical protein GY762_00575 [Proteobacteria bacterium]|nr:hypothetical protein [Pseudomonadota bacterium]